MSAPDDLRRIEQWNATAYPYSADATICDLIAAAAARWPDRPALIDDAGVAYTHRTLDERSSGIARLLAELGQGEGRLIAYLGGHTPEAVAALLGILKTGAAYLPLDPSWPKRRIAEILEPLEIECLVCGRGELGLAVELARSILSVRHLLCPEVDEAILPPEPFDSENVPKLWDHAASFNTLERSGEAPVPPMWRILTGWHVTACQGTALMQPPFATSLAYVLFTSGSTGRPKGVMVQHRPVVNLIEFVARTYGIRPDDRLLFVTSFTFDLSVYDMFGVLAAGASVRILSDAQLRDPDKVLDVLWSEPITIWDSAPAAFLALIPLARLRRGRREGPLLVFLGGDWIPLALPDEIRRLFPGSVLVSVGGATEATVWSIHFRVNEVDPKWPSIPYGMPIQNARYYVLDEALNPCPIGEEGDLYIGGECLSLGYLGAPALTAAKFLPDPFAPAAGARMYATGDRALWCETEWVEFRGRIDDQVKVRGYRIELGEVQAALTQCGPVIDSVVLAVGSDATRRLVGFVLAPSRPDPAELLVRLRERLPAPMIPSTITVLDSFPVGTAGKTDRTKLREWAENAAPPLPRPSATETAEIIRDLWSSLLAVERPAETDDFFSLGGHSLVAVQLIAQLREIFAINYEVLELFDRPLLSDMMATVQQRVSHHGWSPGAGS